MNKFNIPADRIIITLPGRITPIKGQDYLIEALKLVKHKNFYCILVGKKDKHKKYIEKIDNAVKGNIIQEKDLATGEVIKRVKMTEELNNLLLEMCE